jgi:glycosyltransferase involved in cell wall biosynthesis
VERSFSIVVSAYNRGWCIERALLSAVAFLNTIGGGEIVFIDDFSRDDSFSIGKNALENAPDCIRCIMHRNPRNLGVCGAKNMGAKLASGEWVVFLDSDDELIPVSAKQFNEAIALTSEAPVHFFRCENANGAAVENNKNTIWRSANELIMHGTSGESLPVVSRSKFLSVRYDEDLKGHEGLAYVKMAKLYGPLVIHPVVARRYYTDHSDRLSSPEQMRMRSWDLAKGYFRMSAVVLGPRGIPAVLLCLLKAIYHTTRSIRR